MNSTVLKDNDYKSEVEALLTKNFVAAGYTITKHVELDTVPENAKYDAVTFGLNKTKIVYRKGKVTPDRPGAFLAIWQRPGDSVIGGNNKPIPLTEHDLDYLFIKVHSHQALSKYQLTEHEATEKSMRQGMFIFPVSLLIKKGIVCSDKHKGKTGFRVFPPWSEDRGHVGTKVFSESGKKTQRWQLPYFLEIESDGSINQDDFVKVFNIQ